MSLADEPKNPFPQIATLHLWGTYALPVEDAVIVAAAIARGVKVHQEGSEHERWEIARDGSVRVDVKTQVESNQFAMETTLILGSK